MALADIVNRIGGDAESEAQSLVERSREAAEKTLASAREEADAATAHTLAEADKRARAEAETIRAAARLSARDRALAEKRALVGRVLDGARDALIALSDEAYADFLAKRVVAAVRSGETVRIAAADASRLAERLPAAVERLAGSDLGLQWSAEPAPIERGAVLEGKRVTVDLSVHALVAEREDELAMAAAESLFGGQEV